MIGLPVQACGRDAHRTASDLDEGAADRDGVAQCSQHADGALVADRVALDGAPIDHDGHHRQHRSGREIDPVDRIVRLVEDLARGKRDYHELGCCGLAVGGRDQERQLIARVHGSSCRLLIGASIERPKPIVGYPTVSRAPSATMAGVSGVRPALRARTA